MTTLTRVVRAVLTVKTSHIGPGFRAQIAKEFGVTVAGLDVTAPVPAYTFTGPFLALRAMERKYFLGDQPRAYMGITGEPPCTP